MSNIVYDISFDENDIKKENSEYNDITLHILNTFNRKSRNENGQFFTPYSLTNICIEQVKKYLDFNNLSILEPSCGSLQFYDTLIKYIDNKSSILLYEKDKNIIKLIKNKIRKNDTLIFDDFLLSNINSKFKFIIGNPPYYELNKNTEYKSKFIKGRYNIYALFVEKCINLLDENGILCFIIPQTLMTNPSFSNLRNYIKNNCNILNIYNLKNFSDDVSQDVNIYIFQKVNADMLNNDYIMTNNLFSYIKENIDYSKLKKIKDICKVSGGTIVWNQHKELLNNDNNGYRLVYNDDIGNIKSNKIKKNKEKGLYINTKKSYLPLPVLFVSRGNKIKYELITESKDKLIGENHVNVIIGKLENLKKIINNFNDDRLQSYIKNILTTLNLSKTQLENIPIFE